MRVRVRSTTAGPWGLLQAGQEGDVPDDVGEAMVKSRAAEQIGPRADPKEQRESTAMEQPETAMHGPPARRRPKHA